MVDAKYLVDLAVRDRKSNRVSYWTPLCDANLRTAMYYFDSRKDEEGMRWTVIQRLTVTRSPQWMKRGRQIKTTFVRKYAVKGVL